MDGFCGGGLYKDNEKNSYWYGSPIRIIQAVREGQKKSRRDYPLEVNYIFIDNRQDHLDYLKNFAMPYAGIEQLSDGQRHEFHEEWGTRIEHCEFLCGNFEDLVNSCVIKAEGFKGHSFFLLDPWGWTDVSMASLRKIQSLKKSEILYTFMIDFIARFMAARNSNLNHAFHHILEAEGYYDFNKMFDLGKPSVQCYLRNESMRLFRDRSNFRWAFTFSMIPRGEFRALYYLIHLSKNLTALQVIKDSFWDNNNLDYQYYFQLYGYAFRTLTFYEDNQLQLKLDINEDNYSYSLKKLHEQIFSLIYHQEEITFQDLCERTMEFNPANRQQYVELINFLKNEGEIEIIRKEKPLNGKKPELQKTDLIKKPTVKQIRLFNLF